MLPHSEHAARTTKQHSCENQQASTSLQACFHARPFFILYILRRRFNYRAARSQDDELVTCRNNQPYGDPSTVAGARSAKGQEKGRPTNSSRLLDSGKNHSEASAELCNAVVSLLVLLGSTTQS